MNAEQTFTYGTRVRNIRLGRDGTVVPRLNVTAENQVMVQFDGDKHATTCSRFHLTVI